MFKNNKVYEKKLISRGDNFPTINFSKDDLDLICVLLHKRNSIIQVQEVLSLSETQLMGRLERLQKEGLIKGEREKYLPTFLVVTEEEEEWFKKLSGDIGDKITQLILLNKEKMMEETFKIPAFSHFTFKELSFFILSDVVLDFIQIDNVEELFLKADRPSRNKKNYYFSIMEKDKGSKKEAFEIYGNHCENIGDAAFCIYGNERYSKTNFATLTERQGKEIFGDLPSDVQNFKKMILDQIIQSQIDGTPLDPNIQSGLQKLNIANQESLSIPILNQQEYQALYHVADIIKLDLVHILNTHRESLFKAYSASLYSEETTFEEFFIWYYHFLYSYVTDELMEIGVIHKPLNGLFQYILI